MFEIYYTSAPQGLKPNTRGFCTVAATEGLPRALAERLETLSAYRHHFAAGDSAGGQNPVSHAHWLLSVAGAQYHVLSRVCDSGMDYTQRTNAFAHHVALDPADVAGAPAGPAALLERPDLLRTGWDGRVGAIPHATAPRLAAGEADFCAAWQNLTGDAGWAGVLAESAARHPPKPICLLFSPDQPLLPLIAEALALLPPALRWQVTFNTYFTSMPPSATCLWRCCLAGGPAADAATRYAATGLVLNLADRSRLPICPETPWTAYARGGPKPPALHTPHSPAPAPAKSAPPPKAAPSPVPPPPSSAPLEPLALQLSEELQAVYEEVGGGRPLSPGLMTVDSQEGQSTDVDTEDSRSARGLILFASALGLVVAVVSIWLIVKALSPAPEPPSDHTSPVVQNDNTSVPPPVPATQPATPAPIPSSESPTPTHTTLTAAPPLHELPDHGPAIPSPHPSATNPPIPPPPSAPSQPVTLDFKSPLKHPSELPATFVDKKQTLALAPADAAEIAHATALQLQFPTASPTDAPRPSLDYDDHEISGTFSQEPDSRAGHPGVALLWKGPLELSASPVVTLRLDPQRGELEVLWKAKILADTDRAKVVSAAYWVLQDAALVARDDRADKSPRLRISPYPAIRISFTVPSTKLAAALHLPTHAPPKVVHGLPDGWDAVAQEESSEPGKEASNPSQVLYIARSGNLPATAGATTPGDLRGWFTIKFQPGWAQVDCNLATQRQDNDRKTTEAQKALTEAETEIKQLIADATLETQPMADSAKQRRQTKLTADLAEPTRRKTDLEKTLAACKLVGDDLAQIKGLDITIDLPAGIRGVTFKFTEK